MKFLAKVRNKPNQIEGKDFQDHPDIIDALEIYKFFKENALGADAQQRYDDFELWKRQIKSLAEDQKMYQKLSKDEKKILDLMENIQIYSFNCNYAECVSQIFELLT